MPALMKVFTRVDGEGKVAIPTNIGRAVGFKPGQLVEMKLVGKGAVLLSARKNAR